MHVYLYTFIYIRLYKYICICIRIHVRLSKFYEALDALTADVAYAHTDGIAKGLALVTAGHYNSVKLGRTSPKRDIHLRSYITAVSQNLAWVMKHGVSNEIWCKSWNGGVMKHGVSNEIWCKSWNSVWDIGTWQPLLYGNLATFGTHRSILPNGNPLTPSIHMHIFVFSGKRIW